MPSKSTVPFALLSAVILLICGCSKQPPVQAAKSGGPVGVRTTVASAREVRRIVESVGTLYPFEEATISAEIDGKADAVNFDLGDTVEAGSILVRINDEEQRYQVAQSEAQLRQSMERLGLKTEKDRINDIRETPDVRRARAELTEAEQRFRTQRSLLDQNIGARTEFDMAQARFQAAQAAYDTVVNQTRNLVQEVERFKAILDLQRKKLRDTNVKAPFRAVVKERLVTPGQFVRTNTPLFSLVKVDPIRLRVEIPERMAPWIKVGQMVDVAVEAFDNRKFQGKIWRIAPTVDQTKRTFVAEALIQNDKGELKPGSYAKAHLPTSKTDRATIIPQLAVYYVLGANKAYVVKNGVIDAREVRLGDRFQNDVEILEGVEDGEMVATTQLARLDTGVRVRVDNESAKSDGIGTKAVE